jgi:hypothetical protein
LHEVLVGVLAPALGRHAEPWCLQSASSKAC